MVLLAGCNQAGLKKQNVSGDQSDPVSITITQGNAGEIESFSADVVTYRGNSRIPGGIQEEFRYRLSVKEIDGQIHSRIDYPADTYSDGILRSSLVVGNEMFIFKTASNELEHRMPLNLKTEGAMDINLSGRLGLVARIPDFAGLQTRLHAVSSDIQTDNDENIVRAVVPYEGFERFTLLLDISEETLIDAEMIKITEEGTVETLSVQYVYQEFDGQLLKVGEIYTTHYDFPYVIDTSDYSLPIIESEEDIPVITATELQKLEEEGALVYDFPLELGDPSDPDYAETIVMLYEELKINGVEDATMRTRW